MTDALAKAELTFEQAHAYVTPRRLALVVDGLPLAQPDRREEKRGPRVDAPAKAIEGFLKANNIAREQCEERESAKGTFLFAVVERRGRATGEVLAELLPAAIAAMPWPKSMRWGEGETRWVRPLHSILALFDGEVVDVTFAGRQSGNKTRGHRFHAGDAFAVSDFADYRDKLRAAKVMLDAAERRQLIADQAQALAQADGYTLQRDEALLAEVAGLVEWPVVMAGEIDERFMALPAEVLVGAMKVHQKYLTLVESDGKLAPRYVAVANLEASDGGAAIRAGNRYVLNARLSDADFFWNADRKTRLEERVAALDGVVFHAKLGSLGDKVTRIETLARHLAPMVGADADLSARAARLAKADLVAEMVTELPELQGVMGCYYAEHDGEDAAVAQAIAEHYSPAGPGDACPTAPISIAVALADKIDTLACFWAIDEKPTGSRDPFALRRAALGVIRMVLENGLRINLLPLFEQALIFADKDRRSGLASSLLEFFADRLKVHLREQGVRHDLVSAIFALGDEDDLYRLRLRVLALDAFLKHNSGEDLRTAYRRAVNILRREEEKDSASYNRAVDPDLLDEEFERALFRAMNDVQEKIRIARKEENFGDAMDEFIGMKGPIDEFFDNVTVNVDDEDQRANRLALLARMRALFHQTADFSCIEGG